MVAAWDEGLVRFGSRVVSARHEWVAASAASFAARVREIAGGASGSLEYDPGIPNLHSARDFRLETIADVYRAELNRLAERERRHAATLVGPHRDDLKVRAANEPDGEPIDLRTFGSGGQQRTAAVALRMVEGETLRTRIGADPLILLDDVFAELDPHRSRRILEWVEAGSRAQVILTAPKPADFVLRGGALPLWRIANGNLSVL